MLPCFAYACEIVCARQHEFSMKNYSWLFLAISILILLPACDVLAPASLTTSTPAAPYEDAAEVMRGICFEAAFDSAQQGQLFVLRDAAALIAFYDLADNSQLCRRPVERVPFDFADGRVLAGLWSTGIGCTARHDVRAVDRNDTEKTLVLRVKFTAEGDCPYELVRPFWIAVDRASDYEITINVEA